MPRWPSVPACHDWLSLDRRGNWRLQGERVTHRGLIDFLNANYAVDDAGCWFVQNGPQRVFVTLACTPWVFRLDAEGLTAHTGAGAGRPTAVFLDEGGNLFFSTRLGIGLLDDRDLPAALDECLDTNGVEASEDDLLAALAGDSGRLVWRGLALQPIRTEDLPARFNFNPKPRP